MTVIDEYPKIVDTHTQCVNEKVKNGNMANGIKCKRTA